MALPSMALAEDFHRGAAAGVGHALVAELGDELRFGLERLLDHDQFRELVDQRFLAIDMFVVGHRGEQDRRVRVVRHGDDHRIELVGVLGERLAVVAAGEGVRDGPWRPCAR